MTTHLESELCLLRNKVLELWELVLLQLRKSREAFENFDKDLANEVDRNERRVNALELGVDKDCEDLLALYHPVAIDLRFVLSVLKINYNLERIGDYAQGIAIIISDAEMPFDKVLSAQTRIHEMFDTCILMLQDALDSFEKENNKLARTIFAKDEILDGINFGSIAPITEFLRLNPTEIEQGLKVQTIIKKLERVGDQTKNIAEEIIFYIEAKVLRHMGKKAKIEE